MLQNLLRFVHINQRLIAFGFIAAFTSSFGQTYFIGIFGPELQKEFGLSHTTWGSIYLIGTLASAAVLPFSGKLIDQMSLPQFTLIGCGLLIFACGSTSLVTGTLTMVLSVFLLRHAGQGLMSHIAITTMARHFHAGRGRAIAIAALGYSLGEATLPFVAVLTIAALGWRWTFGCVALLLLLLAIPIFSALLKDSKAQSFTDPKDSALQRDTHASTQRSWTRVEVLGDPRLYLLLPGLLSPPIISTAMFFHHLTLADAKGWSYTWITGSYLIYAVSTIITTLVAGQLIDRIGALRLVPYMLIPVILAMLVIAVFNDPLIVLLYMILLGINIGIVHTAVSAMWAELYGVHHLGAIRSFATAVSVFGTALGPVILGGLVDWGWRIEQVCLLFAAYSVFGTCMLFVAFRQR